MGDKREQGIKRKENKEKVNSISLEEIIKNMEKKRGDRRNKRKNN